MWAKPHQLDSDQNNRWVGELAYSYVVESEYYSGFHHLKARNERQAEKLVDGWKGRSIIVRYSGSKHATSVLLKDDQIGSQLGN